MSTTTTDTNIQLQYWNGKHWVPCGVWGHEHNAWVSLGGDDRDYRTVDSTGKVLTDKRKVKPLTKQPRERNEN